MNIGDKLKKFDKRWNIAAKENSLEEFLKFKVRVLNIFRDIDQHVPKESVSMFCRILGIYETPYQDPFHRPCDIYSVLEREDTPIDFYKILEIIFALEVYTVDDWEETYSKEKLYKELREAIEFSNVDLAITKDAQEIILYPKGEGFMDENLVNQTLSFLNIESSKHFEEALHFYGDKKWIKSAESLRRSLEEFLRFKLKNRAGLDANIVEINKYLKAGESPAQVRNVIAHTFKCLDLYFNENTKHNDGNLSEVEGEYLIYQVGLLMRYIYKIRW